MIRLLPPKPDQIPCTKKKKTKPKTTISTTNDKKISSWFKKSASTDAGNANTSESSAPIASVVSTSVHRSNIDDRILPNNKPDLA